MAAPVTMGKFCTNTSDMEIGDYIKCVYEAPTVQVAGYFSQLGIQDPTMTVTTTKTTDGVTAETITEEVLYSELSTTPETTASGYFYLLKADYGLLIADRMVQQQISWEALNKLNYIYGGVFDVVNGKTKKDVNITTTHTTVESSDTTAASDNTTTDVDELQDRNKRHVKTTRTQVTVTSNYDTDGTTVLNKTVTTIVTVTEIWYAYVENESLPDSSTEETDPDKIIGKITGPTNAFY